MSSPSTAKIDCQSCRKRRIRCDRTTPHCVKCRRKGLECPGYQQKLRWTNSIATRGRFKGLGAPDLTKAIENNVRPDSAAEQIDTHVGYQELEPTSLPEGTQEELIHYYTTEIAPFNVWVESPNNEYKRLVIPLARKQSVLRFAIIAIAAAHKPPRSSVGLGISRQTSERAVAMITEHVRILSLMDQQDISAHIDRDPGSSEAFLAAALVLSNHSLFESEVPLALFHLQAARVLIKTFESSRTSNDELFLFLKNQVASLDIIACTTLFREQYVRGAVLPGAGIFGRYLEIIQMITLRSLQKEQIGEDNDAFSFSNLEDQLEMARGVNLMASGRLLGPTENSYQRDVIRLIHSYHDAGLLYACQRLTNVHLTSVEIHVDKLFRTLKQFEMIDQFVGCLSWPVFIGGICCSTNHDRMNIVRSICQMLSEKSTYGYFGNILIFLEELWASSHHDWTLIAREWEDRGVPILAV